MICLKTYFVVKVNDMESVEKTMHDAFDKGQVINSKGIKTELFVADKDKAKNALAQMGEQIYPETTKKLKSTSTSSDSEIKNAYNKFFNEFMSYLSSKNNEVYTQHLYQKNYIDLAHYVITIRKKENIIEIKWQTREYPKDKDSYNKLAKNIDKLRTTCKLNIDKQVKTTSSGNRRGDVYYTIDFNIENYTDNKLKSLVDSFILFRNSCNMYLS